MPTHYRATVSGLRYVAYIAAGAVSLALEGRLYDHFGAHAPFDPNAAVPDHPALTLIARPFSCPSRRVSLWTQLL